ncbi:hypothetical protein ADUPG1_011440, partial [Aduncisulcus paluster]
EQKAKEEEEEKKKKEQEEAKEAEAKTASTLRTSQKKRKKTREEVDEEEEEDDSPLAKHLPYPPMHGGCVPSYPGFTGGKKEEERREEEKELNRADREDLRALEREWLALLKNAREEWVSRVNKVLAGEITAKEYTEGVEKQKQELATSEKQYWPRGYVPSQCTTTSNDSGKHDDSVPFTLSFKLPSTPFLSFAHGCVWNDDIKKWRKDGCLDLKIEDIPSLNHGTSASSSSSISGTQSVGDESSMLKEGAEKRVTMTLTRAGAVCVGLDCSLLHPFSHWEAYPLITPTMSAYERKDRVKEKSSVKIEIDNLAEAIDRLEKGEDEYGMVRSEIEEKTELKEEKERELAEMEAADRRVDGKVMGVRMCILTKICCLVIAIGQRGVMVEKLLLFKDIQPYSKIHEIDTEQHKSVCNRPSKEEIETLFSVWSLKDKHEGIPCDIDFVDLTRHVSDLLFSSPSSLFSYLRDRFSLPILAAPLDLLHANVHTRTEHGEDIAAKQNALLLTCSMPHSSSTKTQELCLKEKEEALKLYQLLQHKLSTNPGPLSHNAPIPDNYGVGLGVDRHISYSFEGSVTEVKLLSNKAQKLEATSKSVTDLITSLKEKQESTMTNYERIKKETGIMKQYISLKGWPTKEIIEGILQKKREEKEREKAEKERLKKEEKERKEREAKEKAEASSSGKPTDGAQKPNGGRSTTRKPPPKPASTPKNGNDKKKEEGKEGEKKKEEPVAPPLPPAFINPALQDVLYREEQRQRLLADWQSKHQYSS